MLWDHCYHFYLHDIMYLASVLTICNLFELPIGMIDIVYPFPLSSLDCIEMNALILVYIFALMLQVTVTFFQISHIHIEIIKYKHISKTRFSYQIWASQYHKPVFQWFVLYLVCLTLLMGFPYVFWLALLATVVAPLAAVQCSAIITRSIFS